MAGTLPPEAPTSAARDDAAATAPAAPSVLAEPSMIELSSSVLLEEAAPAAAPPAAAGAAGAPPSSLVGSMISGRYRIHELIGEGGMGAVYRGEQVHLRKQVAVKVLRPAAQRMPELVARFEREAVAGAHIQHANVVSAIDFGKLEDESQFLVLEYVEGTPLKELMASGPMPAPRALRFARQIACALEAVHAKGIVHRDVKPQNVLVTAGDQVKLIDFGLAKVNPSLLSSPSRETAKTVHALTTAGEIFGTIAYLAPEAGRGMDSVDARADLYALGLVLYEMLSGKHPFDARDVISMLKHQRTEDPPPLSARAPEIPVSPLVEPLVMRLIQRDPNHRTQSAAEVVAAIDEARAALERGPTARPDPAPAEPLSIAPVSAGPSAAAPAAPDAWVPLRRRPPSPRRVPTWMLAAGAAAPLLLGGLLFLALRDPDRPDAEAAPVASTAAPAPEPPETAPASSTTEARPAQVNGVDAAGWRERLRKASQVKNWALGAEAVLALAQIEPEALTREELRGEVVSVAAGIGFEQENEAADQVFELLTNRLGAEGLDLLFEIVRSRGGTKAGQRASNILARPDVSARATPALRVSFDFRRATCTEKRKLLDRAVAEGDQRTLFDMQVAYGTRCRDRDPCCFREDGAFGAAIRKLKERLGT